MTRGERNFNPGNLDRNATKWQGMAVDQSGDDRFVVFVDPVFGIRALARVILSYYRKNHLNTVKAIIDRWAPPVENDTGSYVSAVCKDCGIQPDDTINPQDPDTLEQLVRAIIHEENGRISYDDATIIKAVGMALE